MIQPLDDSSPEVNFGSSGRHHRQGSYALMSYIILLGIIIVLAAVLVFKPNISLPKWLPGGGTNPAIVASDYQAVFLSNNQIYFGKVSNLNSQFPVLSDVFYLQVSQNIQPGQAGSQNVKIGKENQPVPAAPQNELTLIKLGGEIHGPTDQIQINRDHIIFIEDLKNDSKVVVAIQQYKQQNPASVKF